MGSKPFNKSLYMLDFFDPTKTFILLGKPSKIFVMFFFMFSFGRLNFKKFFTNTWPAIKWALSFDANFRNVFVTVDNTRRNDECYRIVHSAEQDGGFPVAFGLLSVIPEVNLEIAGPDYREYISLFFMFMGTPSHTGFRVRDIGHDRFEPFR